MRHVHCKVLLGINLPIASIALTMLCSVQQSLSQHCFFQSSTYVDLYSLSSSGDANERSIFRMLLSFTLSFVMVLHFLASNVRRFVIFVEIDSLPDWSTGCHFSWSRADRKWFSECLFQGHRLLSLNTLFGAGQGRVCATAINGVLTTGTAAVVSLPCAAYLLAQGYAPRPLS